MLIFPNLIIQKIKFPEVLEKNKRFRYWLKTREGMLPQSYLHKQRHTYISRLIDQLILRISKNKKYALSKKPKHKFKNVERFGWVLFAWNFMNFTNFIEFYEFYSHGISFHIFSERMTSIPYSKPFLRVLLFLLSCPFQCLDLVFVI